MEKKDLTMLDYSYELPEERIAQFPLAERDASKLLVYKNGAIKDSTFRSLAEHLPAYSSLFFNNSKVVQARIRFKRATGASIEIFCLAPVDGTDPEMAFQQTGKVTWQCLVGNLKRWKEKTLELTIAHNGKELKLFAEKGERTADGIIINFSWQPAVLSFAEVMELAGEIPLPPYMNRTAEASDAERYQTIYATPEGSVAAPTAGLHFTEKVFKKLSDKQITKHWLTLHVGAGTFKPVKSETMEGHEMHWERIYVTRQNIEGLLQSSGSVVAVGTTSARTLESLYWIGQQLSRQVPLEADGLFRVRQWEPYEQDYELSTKEALQLVLEYMNQHGLEQIRATTQLMIAPGYKFRIVKGLITNFHQPGSTLLLLVAALIGEDWKKVYQHALKNNYRFLSYGDSCLLWPIS